MWSIMWTTKLCLLVMVILFGIFHRPASAQEGTEENNLRMGRRIDPQTISVQEVLRNFRNSLRSRGKSPPLPNYARTQPSNFSCTQGLGPGYYSDPAFGCQQYYRCDDKLRRSVFICPPGTLFNQLTLVCDFPYNVDCSQVANYYEYSNSRLYQNNIPLLETISAQDATNNYKTFYNQDSGQSQSSSSNLGQSSDSSASADGEVSGAGQASDGTVERGGRFGMVMFRPNNVGQSQSSTKFSKKNRIVAASAVASPPPSQVMQGKQLPLAVRKPVSSSGNVPLQGPGHGDTGNSPTSSSNINQYMVNPYPTLTTYSIDPTHQSPASGDTSTNRLANATSTRNKAESNGGASASVSSNAATGTDGPTQPSADDSFDGLMDFSTNIVQAGGNQPSSGVSTVGQAQTAAGSTGGNDQAINRAATSDKQARTGISSSSASATAFGTTGQSQSGFQTSRQTLLSAGSSSLGQSTQQGSGVSIAGQAQTGGRTGVNNQETNSAVGVASQGRPGVSASGSSQFPGQTSLGSATASSTATSGQGGQQATSGSLQTSITGSGTSGQNAQQGISKQTSTSIQNFLLGRVPVGTSTQASNSFSPGGSLAPPLDINSNDDRFTSIWGPPNTDASVSIASAGKGDGSMGASTGQRPATAASSSANTAQGNGPRGIVMGQGIGTGQAGVSGVAVGQSNNAYDLQFQNIWMPVPPDTDSMHFSATPDFNRYNELPGARIQGPSQEREGQVSAAGMSSSSQASANAQRTSTNSQGQTVGMSSNRVFVSGEATITSNPLQVQMPAGPASLRNPTQARTVSPQTGTGNASPSAASASGTSRPNQYSSSAATGGSSGSSASSSRTANSQSINTASSNTAQQTSLAAAHPITVKIFTACDKDATSSLAATDMGSAMLKSLQSSSTLRQTSSSQHATVIVNGYASYNSDVTGATSGTSINRSGMSGASSGATRSAATDYSMPSNPMISDDAYFIHESADKPVFVLFAKYNIIVEIRPDTASYTSL